MAKERIIPNAMGLAESVAKCIVEDSYQSLIFSDKTVEDVLLFGSTVRGQESHDIDLVIVHHDQRLEEFETTRRYDEKTLRYVVDFEKKMEGTKIYSPQRILEELGYRGGLFSEESFLIHQDCINLLRYASRGEHYSGTYELGRSDLLIKIMAEDYEGFARELHTKEDELISHIKQQMVVYKVKEMFTSRGLKVQEDLDVLVLGEKLLHAGVETDVRRNILIEICRDPTFWQTVLSEGRLYNFGTGKFDVAVGEKYPEALELFSREKKRGPFVGVGGSGPLIEY